MVLVSLMCFLLFGLSTWQVAVHGPVWGADEGLGPLLRHTAPPFWVAEPCADLGSVPVAVPVLVVALGCAFVLRRAGSWPTAVCAVAAMAAVPLTVIPLKAWLHRAGPLGGTGYYPSGHAATAAVAFGGAALLLARAVPRRRRAVFVTAAVLVVVNGAGLVWRGYHWPLDVLASWCLGWLLLALTSAAARLLQGVLAGRRARSAVRARARAAARTP